MYKDDDEKRNAILSFMLKDERDKIPLFELIESEMFYDPTDRKLFKAIQYKGVDDFALKEKVGVSLSRLHDLRIDFYIPLSEEVVQELVDEHYYQKLLTEAPMAGGIVQVSKHMMKYMAARTPREDTEDIVREYEEYEKLYGSAADKGLLGVSTGWARVDQITFGLIPGHIWVVGGYYGSGKSYFGINLANNTLEEKAGVAIFSTEMSRDEYLQRLIGLRAKLGPLKTISKSLIGKEKKERDESRDQILTAAKEGKLHVYDNQKSVDKVRAKVERLKSTTGIDLVIIDYVQNLKGCTKYEVIAEAVNDLQHMAQELGVTVLLVSQINNAAQKEGFDSPVDGFKGAGEIGQVANVAIRIHRKKDEDTKEWTDDFKLAFVKVRHNHGKTLDYRISFPGGEIIDPLNKKKGKVIATPQEIISVFKGL